jgi:hypothetical protein
MRRTQIAICTLFFAATFCFAQQEPCGLRTMTETAAPFYPPIGKAAHVEGNVILLVAFKTTGEVAEIENVNGPKILQGAAIAYVHGWHANDYTGPRTCPIVIRFRLLPQGDSTTPTVVRLDLQHVTISAPPPPPLDSNSHSASIIQMPKTIELLSPFDSNSIQQLYLVIRVGSLTYRP